MSVNGMKPTFTNYEGYQEWRAEWRVVYKDLSQRIIQQKAEVHRLNQEYSRDPSQQKKEELKKAINLRKSMSVNAFKLNTILDEAKKRMAGITKMRQDMTEHVAQFPIEIDNCDRLDFHFNKKHLEFPWIPMWVVKSRGKTFYVNHVDARCPWTTRETPENDSTKGAIRIRNCSLRIDETGTATLESL
jgi:hypothetical protein